MHITVCILGASSYETCRANDTASILVLMWQKNWAFEISLILSLLVQNCMLVYLLRLHKIVFPYLPSSALLQFVHKMDGMPVYNGWSGTSCHTSAHK